MKTTIQNEFLTVTVDTHGAEVVSGKNQLGKELIWQADPSHLGPALAGFLPLDWTAGKR